MRKEPENREQRTYLGLPSSGVPDLKGKQEHSQKRTQVQNTGIRLVDQTESGRRRLGWRDKKKEGDKSNTEFTLFFLSAAQKRSC